MAASCEFQREVLEHCIPREPLSWCVRVVRPKRFAAKPPRAPDPVAGDAWLKAGIVRGPGEPYLFA